LATQDVSGAAEVRVIPKSGRRTIITASALGTLIEYFRIHQLHLPARLLRTVVLPIDQPDGLDCGGPIEDPAFLSSSLRGEILLDF
jgi:hypothetical protein